MPEFIMEILVVVDAPTPSEAERYGEQLAGVIRKTASKSVKNVLVSDVRGDTRPTMTNGPRTTLHDPCVDAA